MDSYDAILETILFIVFAFAGLCLGSFATAVIHREREGKPWFQWDGPLSRSACPHCNLNLGIRDLVPVFSWLFLKGKCRNCKAAIPIFYPFIEILCMLCAVFIFWHSGLTMISITALICLPFIVSLVYLGVVHRNFSLRLVIILAVIGFAAFLAQILAFI